MPLVKCNHRSVSLIVLPAIALALFLASATRGERLPVKSYSLADGMPHGQVASIMQDSQGFMWFCTWHGISRFDGYGFTNYGTKEGLSSFGINDIKETRSGTYWIATNGDGVCRFNPRREQPSSAPAGSHSRFTVYRVGDEAATNRVNALYEDREGRLWAGTDGGLFVFDEGKNGFVRVVLGVEGQQDRSVLVWTFVEDQEGSLWIGRTAGLTRRLPDGRWLNYSMQFDQADNQVLALLEDPDQRLWIGTRRGLVVLRPDPLSNIEQRKLPWKRLIRGAIGGGGAPQPLPEYDGDACLYTAADRPGRDYVRALHRSADGHIWIGVIDGGLVEFDGKGFRRYTTAHGLTDDNIRSVFEDRDGNMWIGSVSSGVMKLTRNGFITYDTKDGLGHIIISSVFENRGGEFFATSGDWRINRLDGDRFSSVRVNLPPRIPDSEWRAFCSVIQDHAGEWWVATIEGLFRFATARGIEHLAKTEPIAHYTKKDGLAEDYVCNLFEDSQGDIWISTFAASKDVLTRWERASGKFHRYSESDGLLPSNAARSFVEDSSKNLWIGFRNGGVARYREGRFRLYTAQDGFPSGTVNDFLLDRVGRLWITINPGGLFRVDDPSAEEVRFVGCRTGEDFSSSYPSFIAEDLQGRIYITMPRGIDRFDPTTGQTTRYTFADGLPTGRTHRRTAINGVLWFGTEKGLLRLVPGPDRPAEPPLPFISGLRIAGEPYPISDFRQTNVEELELGPNQNQIQIDFFALSLAAGESLRYQYRIEGAGQDWSAPISERSVNVSLSPGSYRLVRAIALMKP
jgi:ligand-binding sensor domain-containing protein